MQKTMIITEAQAEKYRDYTFAFFNIKKCLQSIIEAKEKSKQDTSTEQRQLNNLQYLDLFTFTKLSDTEQTNIFDNL